MKMSVILILGVSMASTYAQAESIANGRVGHIGNTNIGISGNNIILSNHVHDIEWEITKTDPNEIIIMGTIYKVSRDASTSFTVSGHQIGAEADTLPINQKDILRIGGPNIENSFDLEISDSSLKYWPCRYPRSLENTKIIKIEENTVIDIGGIGIQVTHLNPVTHSALVKIVGKL